jgi:hypothetical protein
VALARTARAAARSSVGRDGDHREAGVSQAVPADLAVPETAERAAADAAGVVTR